MAEKMARRRVKLYALNSERQWDDRGTGHVTSTYVERLKGMSLLVRAETDGTPLLESKIQTDTAYQKQQGTLIVWSEGDNFDLALSFQEKAGCDEIWEKICQVQGKDPSLDITQEVVDESEEERFEEVNESSLWVELPPCELDKLEQISELIAGSLHNVNRQDKIANTIENESYIKKLLTLFRTCEDLENTESLHILYEIFKNIFLLNKNSLLEVLFADENIFDVVGALEYDPSSPYPKKHRDFLRRLSNFKEVIPLENNELINKIHQTYRVQYIQDVALPNQAVYEENMPSTLSSFIFFNKVEIVSMIQEDERFLNELFVQLGSEDVSIEKRRDLILFLKEFCTFSQTLQPPNRENFYKTLSSFGVLGALECTLAIDEPVVKTASVDVLGFFVEFSPSMVRDYMLQQEHKVDEEHYLLNIMLEQMVLDCDPEMGGAVQLMGILRILVDPENMLATNNKAERADFLLFFYNHSMKYLIAPLLSNTADDAVVWEDYQTAQLVALILELLAFCVEHHSYHIKNYIIRRDLLRRIMVLMKSKHTFLVLSAVRFIRKIIGMKDEFYNRHIISTNLFAPIVDTYARNNARYNLLDSAILEIFEYIKTEDIKSLTMYVMEKFGDVFNRIEYVQTFVALRTRYNQHQDKLRDREKSTAAVESLGLVRAGSTTSPGRYRRDMRDMEVEEEMWFSTDDCEEEYHSPLKQELLKGGAAGDGGLDDSVEEDEEEGVGGIGGILGSTSPHRLGATPLLHAQEPLHKEIFKEVSNSNTTSSSGGGVAGLGVLEVSPSSPSSLCRGSPDKGGSVSSPASGVSGSCIGLHRQHPILKACSTGSISVTVYGAAGVGRQADKPGVGPACGRKISLVDYDENSDEEEEEDEEDVEPNSDSCTVKTSPHVSKSKFISNSTLRVNTASPTSNIKAAAGSKNPLKTTASVDSSVSSTTTSSGASVTVTSETEAMLSGGEDENLDTSSGESSSSISDDKAVVDTTLASSKGDSSEGSDSGEVMCVKAPCMAPQDSISPNVLEEADSSGKSARASDEQMDSCGSSPPDSEKREDSPAAEDDKTDIGDDHINGNTASVSAEKCDVEGEEVACSSLRKAELEGQHFDTQDDSTKEDVSDTMSSKTTQNGDPSLSPPRHTSKVEIENDIEVPDNHSKCTDSVNQDSKCRKIKESDLDKKRVRQEKKSSKDEAFVSVPDCEDVSKRCVSEANHEDGAPDEGINGTETCNELLEGETQRKKPRLIGD